MKCFNIDCILGMSKIETESIDAIICDLPYGTTGCKWDTIIPFTSLWEQYHRIIKPNGNIVLFGSQPFTSTLIMSNIKSFRYEIIWEKEKPSNFSFSKYGIMKYHENIIVFGNGKSTYNPQMTKGIPNHSVGKGIRNKANESGADTRKVTNKTDGLKHPKSVIKFNRESKPIHPTQKPIALMEYLIKTYTNEGETVLDNCMGSGSTGVACKNLNRKFIGIEKDENYFANAVKRIQL